MEYPACCVRKGITNPLGNPQEEMLIFDGFEKKSRPTGCDIEESESQLLGYLSKIGGLVSPIARLHGRGISRTGRSAKQDEGHEQL
jgi:hypothetical protein